MQSEYSVILILSESQKQKVLQRLTTEYILLQQELHQTTYAHMLK